MNQNKCVLFYSSNNCTYSREFLKLLDFSKELKKNVMKINILTTTQQLPGSLNVVPTIYIGNNFQKIEGEAAFKWLQQTILAEQRNTTLGNSATLQTERPLNTDTNQPPVYNPNINLLNNPGNPKNLNNRIHPNNMNNRSLQKNQTPNNSQIHMKGSMKQSSEPIPFYPTEMSSSMSDKFSFLDNNNPIQHNYSFLDSAKKDIQNHIKKTHNQRQQSQPRQRQLPPGSQSISTARKPKISDEQYNRFLEQRQNM